MEDVRFYGHNIVDKHTHYEVVIHLGPIPAKIIIQGTVAAQYLERFKKPLTNHGEFSARLNFGTNGQSVAKDVFAPAAQLRATVSTLDELIAR
jgi:hypothetical protein